MKAQTAPAGNRELRVTIEVDPSTVEGALKEVASKLAGRINIPGFRKSRIPYRVLERYVGRTALLAQAHEDLAQQALRYFLAEAQITEPEHVQLDKIADEPVVYTFTIALEPYVDLPTNYRALRIEPRDLELTAQEKEDEKAGLCDRFARREEVTGPIAWDDSVILDIKGVVLDENQEPTDEVVLEDDEWQVELSAEHPLGPPNLEQEILGLNTGDSKEFVLTYPEDSESVYAGRSAHFAIRVVTVERQMAAPWNAETLMAALELDPSEETRTLEEYEDIFWQRMSTQKATRIFDEELKESLQLLEDVSVVEFADASVDNQIDLLVNQRLSGLAHFGIRNLETYLRYTNQSEEEFRESLRTQAQTELVHKLLVWEFIRLEDIQISADVQRQLHEDAARNAEAAINAADPNRQPAMTENELAELLSQRQMTAHLLQMGHNALVELCTDGTHSPNQFLAALNASDTPEEIATPVDVPAAATTQTS